MNDKDYTTGKPVNFRNPEESVRQDTERWLVEELQYSKDRLDIEYRIRIGSRKVRPDIIIFRKPVEPNLDQHKDILGLVYEREQAKQDLEASDILMVKDGGHRIGETVMLSEEDLDTIDRLRDIPIPYPNEDKQKEIAAQMREILEERQIHRKNLDTIS